MFLFSIRITKGLKEIPRAIEQITDTQLLWTVTDYVAAYVAGSASANVDRATWDNVNVSKILVARSQLGGQ